MNHGFVNAPDRRLVSIELGGPVLGIEILGCRPHWTSPLCEIGISARSVYQMTTSREQVLGEGNCGRSNAPPRQADPAQKESQGSLASGQDDCLVS
jgi:hypothetical protein